MKSFNVSLPIMDLTLCKSENKYHNSPLERGVGVCYIFNNIYFLIYN